MQQAETFEALADSFLSRSGVAIGRSLNNDTLTVGGKIFAFLKDEQLVAKVPAATVVQLIGSHDGRAFTAGGRAMREWVMVAEVQHWPEIMEQAYRYVGGQQVAES